MSLTGQEKYRKGFEPMLEDVTFVEQNNLEALHAAVNANTCAIVLEPILAKAESSNARKNSCSPAAASPITFRPR